MSLVSVVRPEELLLEGELPDGQAAQEAVWKILNSGSCVFWNTLVSRTLLHR